MQNLPNQEQEAVKDEIRDLFKTSPWLYQLVADLGHDLRTPLSGIIGLNELLMTSSEDEQKLQYLQAAQTCANSLLMTVNEVVDLARIDAGRLKLQQSSMRVADILAECNRALAPLAQAQQTKIETAIDGNLPDYVVLDSNRIKQVVNILLTIYLRISEGRRVVLKCDKIAAKSKALVRFGCIMEVVPDFALADLYAPFLTMESSVPPSRITNWLRLRLANRLVNFMSGHTSAQVESDGSFGTYFALPLSSMPEPSH